MRIMRGVCKFIGAMFHVFMTRIKYYSIFRAAVRDGSLDLQVWIMGVRL